VLKKQIFNVAYGKDKIVSHLMKFSFLFMLVLGVTLIRPQHSHAESAVFSSETSFDVNDLNALSTSGDNSGILLGENESFRLVFDTPFATQRSDSVSIFTLPPDVGVARITVNFGFIENGNVQIARTFNFRSGRDRNFNNLFNQGCRDFGGCNFIEIITDRTRRGAEGVRIDYVQINGEVVTVAAATPEPTSWAFMILGFLAVSLRMKAMRTHKISSKTNIDLEPDIIAPNLAVAVS